MGTTIRELFVKLGIKADTKAIAQFDRGISQIKTGMADLAKVSLVAAAAVAAMTAVIVTQTIAVAAQGDEIAKSAAAIGMSTEELQKWRFAAERSGVTADQLRIGLITLTRNMEAAGRGTGEAAEAFAEFGIDVKNADGSLKSQEQLLLELADAYNSIEDPVKRAALLTRIFGESGAAMGPLLAQGAEGIEELMARAEELGIIMSEEQVAAATALTDSLTDVRGIMTGIRNTIFLSLAPVLTGMLNQFTEWYLANRELINQRIDSFMENVATTLAAIPEKAAAILEFFGGLEFILIGVLAAGTALIAGFLSIKVLFPIISILSGLFSIIGAIAGALAIGFAPAIILVVLVMGQLLFIVGQLMLIFGLWVLIIQDFYTFLNGGDSVIGRFLEQLGLSEQAMASFWGAIDAGKEIGLALLDLMSAMGDLFLAVVTPAIVAVGEALKPLWDLFIGFLSWLGGGALDTLDAWVEKLEQAAALIREAADLINSVSGGGGDVASAASNDVGGSAVSSSSTSQSNNVSQSNQINVNGAGDPNAVANGVVNELGSLLNSAGAAFAGGDI